MTGKPTNEAIYEGWQIISLKDEAESTWRWYAIKGADRSPLYTTRHYLLCWIEGKENSVIAFDGLDLRTMR